MTGIRQSVDLIKRLSYYMTHPGTALFEFYLKSWASTFGGISHGNENEKQEVDIYRLLPSLLVAAARGIYRLYDLCDRSNSISARHLDSV